ncbi:uncharacterized protein N0V89_011808 [Didymosphaeria variabile]|uniref:Uncharacterized protein n=1 Tax=Didymosphaeria variabile TaxID=1932322 RepID=A0A9W8XBZ5_9PLEO|nr:uncharacterized protein N0V89_011808 [Didymosphaeria variabile]KAJ4345673.1 hypothetical protein N0V89_011808 [Didymosphaeria variabile]
MESAPNRVQRVYHYGVRLINLVSEAIAPLMAAGLILVFQILWVASFIVFLSVFLAMVIVGTTVLVKFGKLWSLRG